MPRFKKSRFTVEFPVETQEEEMVALFQTLTGAFILFPERHWSYVLSDPISPFDPATIDMLCKEGFLVSNGVDEIVLYENWKQQYVHDYSLVQSRVLVTRNCNNSCAYCIIDPEAREMSAQTARAMDRFYLDIIGEKHPQQVSDNYLGGEPLLNPGIILDSASRRFHFCQGKGIPYGFIITTNGTLVQRDVIEDMKSVGLSSIRVSMAGPSDVHDRLRPLKNQGKTYELILHNLESVSDLVQVSIECQYDSGSQDFIKLPRMLDDMAERHIQVESIAFTPILPQRGKISFNTGMGDPNIFLYLKHEAEKRGFPMNEEPPSSSCMAEFKARFIFDTDGSIIPCPSVQGGEMAYGDVYTGIDFVAESQLRRRNLSKKCLNQCELLPLCMGGCRLQALIKNKSFSGVDCHYDTYRFLLEEYIRGQVSAVLSDKEDADLSIAA